LAVFCRGMISGLERAPSNEPHGINGGSCGLHHKKLEIAAMTAVDSYRQSPPCMETVSAGTADSGGKRKRKTVAA
jgi:hypothetical protein